MINILHCVLFLNQKVILRLFFRAKIFLKIIFVFFCGIFYLDFNIQVIFFIGRSRLKLFAYIVIGNDSYWFVFRAIKLRNVCLQYHIAFILQYSHNASIWNVIKITTKKNFRTWKLSQRLCLPYNIRLFIIKLHHFHHFCPPCINWR